MSQEQIVYNLELNVENTLDNSRKIELILFRVLGLWGRMCRLLGVPEDSPIVAIVEKVQRLVMVFRQLHSTMLFLEAASGPIGWAMFGVSAAGTAMATIELGQEWGSTQA